MNAAVLGTLASRCVKTYNITYDGNGEDAPVDVLSGTAYSSSYYTTGNKAYRANDGEYESLSWASDNYSFPHWWKCDLGEGVTKTLRTVWGTKIYGNTTEDTAETIIQGSNDNSTWTDLTTVVWNTPAGTQTAEFINNTAFRYYRFRFLATSGRVRVFEWDAAESCTSAVDSHVAGSYTILGNDSFGFVRSGYVFDGWNTQADGGGTSYAPDEEIELTEDITLYAQWTEE